MTDERKISDADVKAIAEAVDVHANCMFGETDRHDLQTILTLYRESTTALRKGIIGLVLIGALALFIIGGAMSFRT